MSDKSDEISVISFIWDIQNEVIRKCHKREKSVLCGSSILRKDIQMRSDRKWQSHIAVGQICERQDNAKYETHIE
jgi:hypothetical protein